MAVDHEDVVLSDGGRGFGAGYIEVKATLRRVVFHEVGEVVCGNEIVDGNDIKFLSEKALLAEGTKDEPADASEAVNCYFFIRHRAKKVAKRLRSVNERLARPKRRRRCVRKFDAKLVSGVPRGSTGRRGDVPK